MAEKESLADAQESRGKLQKKFSKQCKGSKGREKTKTKMGRGLTRRSAISVRTVPIRSVMR